MSNPGLLRQDGLHWVQGTATSGTVLLMGQLEDWTPKSGPGAYYGKPIANVQSSFTLQNYGTILNLTIGTNLLRKQ